MKKEYSMKHNAIIIAVACLSIIPFFSKAQNNQSFLQKVESIRKDLYKISAHELCTILDVSFNPVPLITADQLKSEMKSDTPMFVINVLPEYYYNDCHIKGSMSAPLKELVEQAQGWDRSQRIVIYCALDECDAGEKGCILLSCMGFTNIADYKGGIKEWYQLEYPTEGPALSEYLHTKGLSSFEYTLYPKTIVCSNQTRWINKYQSQE